MSAKKSTTCLPTIGAFVAGLSCCMSAWAQTPPTGEQVVNALEKQNGVTAGERRNHIVGVCVSGSFVGNKEVQAYSKSALFSGASIPVLGRLSLAGGNPKAPDTAKSPRGMALEFKLPGGQLHHFTMLNVPVFGAATPSTFYEAVQAGTPDPATGKPDADKLKAFRAGHPDVAPLGDYMASHHPPASYATSDYFSIHTFKFVNQNNQTTLVKWQFVPLAGVQLLTDAELTSKPARFLDEDITKRAEAGPLKWEMVLTIGQAGDEEINPTVYWPKDRKAVKAGILTITKAYAQKGADCEKINFDPLVMSDGVAPTADPVLNFRSSAYAASYARRLTNQ